MADLTVQAEQTTLTIQVDTPQIAFALGTPTAGGTGTVTSVTTTISGLTFGANTTTTPILAIQNASAPTTQFLRGDGIWAVPASGGSGTVTSIALTVPTGFAIAGSPITTSGTLAITYSGQIPTSSLGTGTADTTKYLRGDGAWTTFPTIPTGTVTSVAMTVPPALSVAGSPITSSGTLALSWGTGQVPVANLGIGTATTSTFLRGDGNWAVPTGGGGGGGVVIPYVEFTSSATASAGQTFTNVNLAGYNNDATQATVVANSAVLRPTVDYTIAGNVLTVSQWLNANSVIQVQSKGSTAPVANSFIFIARRTGAVAYTGNTNANFAWSGGNVTQDISTIPNFAIINSTVFQNTALSARTFLVQVQTSFQGATANITEADTWFQQGSTQTAIVTVSGQRYGLATQRGIGTPNATLTLTAILYVPAGEYFGHWAYCDQSSNVNGPSSATTIYGIQGDYQNRIVIREI